MKVEFTRMDSISPDTPQKQCGKCQKVQPLINFFRDRAKRDGYRTICKTCDSPPRKHRTGNPCYEAVPESHKRCSNPECQHLYPATTEFFYAAKAGKYGLQSYCKKCILEKAHQRIPLRKEHKQLYHRNYYQEHKERICEQNRAWTIAHAEYLEAHRRAHPEVHKKQHALRRARKKQSIGTFTAEDIQTQYQRQKGKCYWCQKKLDKYHVDHVIPLSRGGSNDASNLVIACPHCNCSKHAKLPHEWPEGGRLL